jgi:hypothetical protein
MMFSKTTNVFLLGASISLFSLISQPQSAAAQSFSVSPIVTIRDMKNGQAKATIFITNNGKETMRFRVYAEDFDYDRSRGFVSITKHPQSAVAYIQFAPQELVIPPGVTRNVRVGTTIPSNLPNGEYRAVIFLEDLQERQVLTGSGSRVQVTARMASLFYFNKGGGSSELQVSRALWNPTTKDIRIVFNNKGSKTIYPAIEWRIEKDGKIIVQSRIARVLVQSAGEREISLSESTDTKIPPLAPGTYSFVGNILETDKKPVPFNIKITMP